MILYIQHSTELHSMLNSDIFLSGLDLCSSEANGRTLWSSGGIYTSRPLINVKIWNLPRGGFPEILYFLNFLHWLNFLPVNEYPILEIPLYYLSLLLVIFSCSFTFSRKTCACSLPTFFLNIYLRVHKSLTILRFLSRKRGYWIPEDFRASCAF